MSDPKYECEVCHVTEEWKFAKARPNLCKECKKAQKPYLCETCGSTDKLNFAEGRYNICRKCRSIKNGKVIKEKRRLIKYQDVKEIETLNKEIPIKEVDVSIEKYLVTNRDLMNGYTIREILENFSAYNVHKSSEDDLRDEEIESLKDEISQIKFILTEMVSLGKFI
jgi:hypothetical protein